MQQILVVDDEVGIRELLSEILRDEGYQVRLAENAGQARAQRAQARPDLVLLDIWMPDTDGITLLREWASSGLLTMPVVMMSGHGTIDTAVEATRIGAYDFLEKPIALQKLLATVGRALKRGEPQVKPTLMLATLGRAAVVTELKQRLERVANLKSPLMMVAEPGSGVELCARFVHQPNPLPGKPNAPWIELGKFRGAGRCAARSVESGARRHVVSAGSRRPHRMEQKGLLLITGKLEKYNTRLICATSRALPELVAQGGFDAKLYSIIAAVTVNVPSLRQHREDIPDLANLFPVAQHRSQRGGAAAFQHRRAQRAAQLRLAGQSEPAGKRRAHAGADRVRRGDRGRRREPGVAVFGAQSAAAPTSLPLDLPLREARDAFERVYFEHHIAKEGGNMSRVADSVGLERTHLYRKLKQLGIKLARRAEE